MEKDKPLVGTLLTIDPAASTGWCVARMYGNEASPVPNRHQTIVGADIIAHGTLRVDTSSNYVGDHCLDMAAQIEALIGQYNVTEIAIEDYYFSRGKATGAGLNVAYRTAIHMAARRLGLPYVVLSISAWKTYIGGSSKPPRTAKAQWGTLAKKMYIQGALWHRYGIRFPNHGGLSDKTGKPLAPKHDVVDVVAMAIYALAMLKHVPDSAIHCTVVPEPDVVWKKVPTGVYDYSVMDLCDPIEDEVSKGTGNAPIGRGVRGGRGRGRGRGRK